MEPTSLRPSGDDEASERAWQAQGPEVRYQSQHHPPDTPLGDRASVRAQLLATEHWSLLATRSTTQAELLSRITVFLTLISASLVSMALFGQVTGFDRRFIGFALALGACVLVIGTRTLVRVNNGSNEDLGLVIGMNRLRAGYVELDPRLAHYLVASTQDDDPGVWQTYNYLEGRKLSQPFASSFAFISFVTSGWAAAVGALAAFALEASGAAVAITAAASGLGYLATTLVLALRGYQRVHRNCLPKFPTR